MADCKPTEEMVTLELLCAEGKTQVEIPAASFTKSEAKLHHVAWVVEDDYESQARSSSSSSSNKQRCEERGFIGIYYSQESANKAVEQFMKKHQLKGEYWVKLVKAETGREGFCSGRDIAIHISQRTGDVTEAHTILVVSIRYYSGKERPRPICRDDDDWQAQWNSNTAPEERSRIQRPPASSPNNVHPGRPQRGVAIPAVQVRLHARFDDVEGVGDYATEKTHRGCRNNLEHDRRFGEAATRVTTGYYLRSLRSFLQPTLELHFNFALDVKLTEAIRGFTAHSRREATIECLDHRHVR